MAISLINRYPDKKAVVRAMTELAQEEMRHFEQVIDKLEERGYELHRDEGDHYVQQLHQHIRKQEPQRLLDTLLVSSLVEARSCERFQLLSESVDDDDLRKFYRSLLESEARHRTEFVQLARKYFDRAEVDTRLAELSKREGEIVRSLQNAATMHG